MKYCRIDLSKTFYKEIEYDIPEEPDIRSLQAIYSMYCSYKGFTSVMPIFDSEFTHPDNMVITYGDEAFSLIRIYDRENAEGYQFAWTYESPEKRLGIKSLQSECALLKRLGFKYYYLGEAQDYKSNIDGYEILGTI